MNIRIAFALVAAAGTPATAQNLMRVTTSWTEMVAGTNTPVLFPDGIVSPGEGAMIQSDMNALRNGQSAIGQVVTFTNGASFTGPIHGIASFVYDVAGGGADATGTWNHRLIDPIFDWVQEPGFILEGGARVHSTGAVQVAYGETVDGTNPVTNAWRGVWNPSSYDQRVVHFRVEASDTVPVGQQNAMFVAVGIEPPTGYTLYGALYFPTDFGPGLDIPVGPGSSPLQTFCYPNCDGSTGSAVLNANDFMCFLNLWGTGNTIANCDGSIREPVLTANDFICYMNKFANPCQ